MENNYTQLVEDDIHQRVADAIRALGPSPDEIAVELGAKRSEVMLYIHDHPDLVKLYRAWLERIVELIVALNGNRTLICRQLRCDLGTLGIWEQQNPRIKTAFKDAEQSIFDLAEQGLTTFLLRQDWKAIKFVLETKGKTRGYTKSPKSTLKDEAERLGISWETVSNRLAEQLVDQLDVIAEDQ